MKVKTIVSRTVAACLAAGALASCGGNAASQQGKTEGEEIFFADPTVYVENGKYYMTGTMGYGSPKVFTLLESTDLEHWTSPDGDKWHTLINTDSTTFGTDMFWAPQIFKDGGKYYLAYTANEQTAWAVSDSLAGPYVQSEVKPIDGSEKNIDPFVFKDDDGKYYLYHVRFNHGNYLWVAEFDVNTGSINPETLKQCLEYSEPWEKTDNGVWDPIMEGPTVIKKDGTYYLIYSANHFENPDYAVGYATALSPVGPWTKHPGSPFIHRSIVGENGSGHGDLFAGLDGKTYYVYHVHNSAEQVAPRRTRIVPLQFVMNDSTGIYDIKADTANIIIPRLQTPLK